MSKLNFYKPEVLIKTNVLGLFNIIVIKHMFNEIEYEYRAYIEHSNSFICSSKDLESLKSELEFYLESKFNQFINFKKEV